MQTSRGCYEPAPIPIFVLDDEKYLRCPLRIITGQTVELLRYFRYYREGHLPVSGGMLDQSAKFIIAIDVILNEIGKFDYAGNK